jgi:hypothetical protein
MCVFDLTDEPMDVPPRDYHEAAKKAGDIKTGIGNRGLILRAIRLPLYSRRASFKIHSFSAENTYFALYIH